MYYGFIDGQFVFLSEHIPYLKKKLDEDMDLFNGFSATIYLGQRSCAHRFYNTKWKSTWSTKKDRPELPEWVKDPELRSTRHEEHQSEGVTIG